MSIDNNRWINLAIVNLVICVITLNGEPCKFDQTVDLTNSQKFENGSYLYDDILIPSNLVGTYNYIYTMESDEKVSVPLHQRGCVCLLKPCVPFCCDRNQTFRNSTCWDLSNDSIASTEILISNEIIDIYEHFAIQKVKTCKKMFLYRPDGQLDEWTLDKNGIFTLDKSVVERDSYCLVNAKASDNSTEYTIQAMGCYRPEIEENFFIKGYTLLFSLPFLLATIIIYLILPELRTVHGKSFICYLLGLFFGYSIICCNIFFIQTYSSEVCHFVGFAGYFCFMSSFIWLNIISFDVWSGFRKINVFGRLNEKKLFWLYFIFAYGIATLLLILSIVMQILDNIPGKFKPGINIYTCFLNVRDYIPAFLYFYGFIIIIIASNTVFFTLTAFKIYNVQKEFDGIMTVTESNKNFKAEHTKFLLFLRLFLIMGVIWLAEIVCYLIDPIEQLHSFTYILDFLNAIQGFVIFVLFVMKNKTKRLLSKRFSPRSVETNKSASISTTLSLLKI